MTRVKYLDEYVWKKLRHILKYIHGTYRMTLNLNSDGINVIHWWVYA